jgi:hypothetical protein
MLQFVGNTDKSEPKMTTLYLPYLGRTVRENFMGHSEKSVEFIVHANVALLRAFITHNSDIRQLLYPHEL